MHKYISNYIHLLEGYNKPNKNKAAKPILDNTPHVEDVVAKAQRLPPSPQYQKQGF